MKIELARLDSSTIKIEEDIEASSWDINNQDIRFRNNLHFSCNFSKTVDEVIVDGEITSEREITCSRCLEPLIHKTKQKFTRNYKLKDSENTLDIDKDLSEEILLEFPMKVLCCSDCKGICPKCGVDLNKGKCQC